MKRDEQDRLKQLFHDVKLENPSGDFMRNLMVRVEKEAIVEKRKKQIYVYLSVVAGMIGVIGISSLIFSLYDIKISSVELDLSSFNILAPLAGYFRSVSIDHSVIMLAVTVLFLLMGDSLIRKFIYKKHHPDGI